jgi:hypothetical protein
VKNLKAYDYNKHYASCLMGQGLKYGWPIYNVFDQVVKIDGKLAPSYQNAGTMAGRVVPHRGFPASAVTVGNVNVGDEHINARLKNKYHVNLSESIGFLENLQAKF